MSFNIPWFIFDLFNKQLITSPTIPLDNITDNKSVVLSEVPIPGLKYDPILPGGMGNRKISFTLPLIKKNNSVGNILVMKQFENLRIQSAGLFKSVLNKITQFNPNPKVLYFWGTGSSVPLEYYVAKCDFIHSSKFVNRLGYPQYSEISIELWLDEDSILNKVEDTFRTFGSIGGSISQAFGVF